MILMKNILVLGSSGQIGSHLCKYLRERNYNVIECDIVNSEAQDLRTKGILDLYFNYTNIDFVFFLAFDVGGSKYLSKYQNTFDFVHNNVTIVRNTFESLKEFNIPFIFASSQMSNMTDSPYGVCKNIGELYTRLLGGITVKFWNVYGIENDKEKAHVITDFISSAKSNHEINMLTDGTEMRQFLYVEDCCEALFRLALNYNN